MHLGNRFFLFPPVPDRDSCPGEHIEREHELDDEERGLEFILARGNPIDDAGVRNLQPKGLVCKQAAQEIERENDLDEDDELARQLPCPSFLPQLVAWLVDKLF